MTREQVASFAQRAFDPSEQVLTVTRTQPLSQGMMVVGVVALIWITMRLLGRSLTTPVQMKELRYIARFRLPLLLRIAYTLGLAAALVAVMMFGSAGAGWILDRWVESVDSYVFQTVVNAAIGVFFLVALSLIYASAPGSSWSSMTMSASSRGPGVPGFSRPRTSPRSRSGASPPSG